jgi:hypothetical protein
MSEQAEPKKYSVAVGQAKGVTAGASVFGLVFFCSWLAQILLPLLEDYKTLIPAEIFSQSGMAGFLAYAYAVAKDKLQMVDKWPKILG